MTTTNKGPTAFVCFRKRRKRDFIMQMWATRIEPPRYERTELTNWPSAWKMDRRIPKSAKPGDMVFIRGELRKRYLVFQVDAQRQLLSMGLEIRFNRRTKRWVVFETGGEPRAAHFDMEAGLLPSPRNDGYETLAQAKASVSLNVLDRLAAEA